LQEFGGTGGSGDGVIGITTFVSRLAAGGEGTSKTVTAAVATGATTAGAETMADREDCAIAPVAAAKQTATNANARMLFFIKTPLAAAIAAAFYKL
jgi:hypothetical protein